MATSGTVSTTVFTTRKVLDHAFRRCKLTPQQIAGEDIETAKDLLWLFLSSLASKGVTLWTIEKEILPMYGYVPNVPLPIGTVNLLDVNLRNIHRPTGTYTASEGDADSAFDEDIETACTQTVGEGWIQVEYDSETRLCCFGILPEVTETWNISIQVSDDGVTWETVYTNETFEAVEQEWLWVDIDGIYPKTYCRLISNDVDTILDVAEFVAGNNPNEIPLALINTDNYDSQPDKAFPGRPTEYRYDRQRTQPIMNLWPAPGPEYTFYQLVARVQRYIQDVGSLTQEIEVPQRWYLAIVCELARQLAYELPQVKAEVMPGVAAEASQQMQQALDGESDGSSTRLRINISPYTR